MTMNWKRWKLGLIVALITGVFSGGVAAFVIPMTWDKVVFIILYNICQNGLLFLKDHPVDEVSDVTSSFTKADVLVAQETAPGTSPTPSTETPNQPKL